MALDRPNKRFNPTCVRRTVSGSLIIARTHARGLTLALGNTIVTDVHNTHSYELLFREKELRVRNARTGPVRTLPVFAIEANDSKFSGNCDILNGCYAQRLIRTSKRDWSFRDSRGDCRSVSNCFLGIFPVIARLLSA
jgi:hypothetical protein